MKLPPVEQIGIVVDNVDEAVEHFTALFGWGPFRIREVDVQGFTFRNRPGHCRLKMAFARSGPIEIELIQVLEGETPHSEFLRQKGEGLHHLRFRVDNYDELLAGLSQGRSAARVPSGASGTGLIRLSGYRQNRWRHVRAVSDDQTREGRRMSAHDA